MRHKPVISRSSAERDVDAAIDYYMREAGGGIALAFIDALEATYEAIAQYPASGSPRAGQDLGLPGLRSRALANFPYLAFYVERADHIDVWRVLDGRRDLPASFNMDQIEP